MSTPSPFHVYALASELEKQGRLERLYTAYPRMKVPQGLRARVRTRPRWVLAQHGARRAHAPKLARTVDVIGQRSFDRWVARSLDRCDVFHCLSGFGLAAQRTAKSRFNARTVCDRGSSHIVAQDTLLREEYERWGVPFDGIPRQIIEREVQEYAQCDAILVPSSFAEQTFHAQGVDPRRVHRIPYGVDVEAFHPDGTSVERVAPTASGPFTVLFAGRASLRKGVPYLMHAVADLLAAGALEVHFAGRVDPEVEPFLAPHLRGVTVLGHLRTEELRHAYATASVLVLPSIEEGLALVQAQAMASGLPVIASVNTGATDLITDGVEGFIVPIRDTDAIRRCLERLLSDRALRDAMGQAAMRRARDLDGWRTYGARVLELYAGLLGDRS